MLVPQQVQSPQLRLPHPLLQRTANSRAGGGGFTDEAPKIDQVVEGEQEGRDNDGDDAPFSEAAPGVEAPAEPALGVADLEGRRSIASAGGLAVAGVGAIKACMLTSFGFGQKGGIVIAVSPRLLFASLPPEQYRSYQERVAPRRRQIDRAYQQAMMDNAVFRAKEQSAWVDWGRKDGSAFLDPNPFSV